MLYLVLKIVGLHEGWTWDPVYGNEVYSGHDLIPSCTSLPDVRTLAQVALGNIERKFEAHVYTIHPNYSPIHP